MKSSALFVAIMFFAATAHAQEDEETQLMLGCSWKDVALDFPAAPNGRLSFRYQDCDSTGAVAVGYSLDDDGILLQKWNAYTDQVARFWPLAAERPSAAIARIASASILPSEKGRCLVHLNMLTGAYAFTPNARYLEELLDRDEPFGACGEFGDSNDSIQYWTVINDKLLAYLWLGQDTPIVDPKSFRYAPK